LSLDGGGIRGLILIQVLSELEKKLGVSILSRFHWLGGTSTGAILALALSQGKSIAHCRSIYFRLKDDVFCGPRPYSDVVLESFLKSEFGEHTTLADIKTKKVMVTTCLANVCPSKLKLFRNYQLHLPSDENDHMGFCSPKNVLVYVAARCSSAAPTYFPPFEGKYMDGGLIANNPCSQLISDIQLMNTSFQMAVGFLIFIIQGKAEHCYRIGCIVSIGTGQTPEAFVESLNLSLPKNIAEVVGLTKNLALANADGSVVDYARSWSHSISVPFFRFSPSLNPAVELDETDDVKLINMMWNTKVWQCLFVMFATV
uniref:PNPLA domain-containing protein n=1 Tax=Angiostrongylus cantonensis TaxID=6313 RepID=A0A0K0D6D2_ANGCA